jgi:hypothetical protein
MNAHLVNLATVAFSAVAAAAAAAGAAGAAAGVAPSFHAVVPARVISEHAVPSSTKSGFPITEAQANDASIPEISLEEATKDHLATLSASRVRVFCRDPTCSQGATKAWLVTLPLANQPLRTWGKLRSTHPYNNHGKQPESKKRSRLPPVSDGGHSADYDEFERVPHMSSEDAEGLATLGLLPRPGELMANARQSHGLSSQFYAIADQQALRAGVDLSKLLPLTRDAERHLRAEVLRRKAVEKIRESSHLKEFLLERTVEDYYDAPGDALTLLALALALDRCIMCHVIFPISEGASTYEVTRLQFPLQQTEEMQKHDAYQISFNTKMQFYWSVLPRDMAEANKRQCSIQAGPAAAAAAASAIRPATSSPYVESVIAEGLAQEPVPLNTKHNVAIIGGPKSGPCPQEERCAGVIAGRMDAASKRLSHSCSVCVMLGVSSLINKLVGLPLCVTDVGSARRTIAMHAYAAPSQPSITFWDVPLTSARPIYCRPSYIGQLMSMQSVLLTRSHASPNTRTACNHSHVRTRVPFFL